MPETLGILQNALAACIMSNREVFRKIPNHSAKGRIFQNAYDINNPESTVSEQRKPAHRYRSENNSFDKFY